MKNLILFVLLLSFAVPLLAAPPSTRPSIEFTQDIQYGNSDNTPLLLDLARPANSPAPLPCILMFHGGGWHSGSHHAYDPAIRTVAAQGYVAATVGYRLVPAAHFPAQIEDCKCAVRYLRSHAAQYNIDPNRIGVIGDSAGGHLVLLLGVTQPNDHLEGNGGWPETSSAVQAVVSLYGPTDLSADDLPNSAHPLIQAFFNNPPPDQYAALLKQASPISYVHAAEPPMLLLQGTSDPLVPYTQATRMAAAMTAVHAPGRVELLLNANHGFQGPTLLHALQTADQFFAIHLKSLKQ